MTSSLQPDTVIGVLLAGGRSARMGRCKQVLPWIRDGHRTTVVAAAHDTIAPFVDSMFITVGLHAPAIRASLGERRVTPLDVDPEGSMLDSARAGIEAALSAGATRVLLHLSDHPGVASGTLERLLDAETRRFDFVHPRHDGRGGHPIVLSSAAGRRILDSPLADGLRSARELPGLTVEAIEVDDPGIHLDLDTPDSWGEGLEST